MSSSSCNTKAVRANTTIFTRNYKLTELACLGDEWTECFTVWDITLPNTPYLGFTAMTGDVSDNHEYVHLLLPST